MNSFLNVLYCTSKNNLSFPCVEVQQSLKNIKRRSLLQETKANSMLERQFNKAKIEIKTKKIESNDRIIMYKATQFASDKDDEKEIVTK